MNQEQPPSENSQSQLSNQNPYQSPSGSNPYPQPQPQPTGLGMHRPPAADGFAITSMVLGIIAIITCFLGIIFGSIAVIFGHLSISRINKDPQNRGGKGMAIAGLVTGYVGILIFLVLVFSPAGDEGNIYNIFGESFQEEFQKEFEEELQRQQQEQRELIPDQE